MCIKGRIASVYKADTRYERGLCKKALQEGSKKMSFHFSHSFWSWFCAWKDYKENTQPRADLRDAALMEAIKAISEQDEEVADDSEFEPVLLMTLKEQRDKFVKCQKKSTGKTDQSSPLKIWRAPVDGLVHALEGRIFSAR